MVEVGICLRMSCVLPFVKWCCIAWTPLQQYSATRCDRCSRYMIPTNPSDNDDTYRVIIHRFWNICHQLVYFWVIQWQVKRNKSLLVRRWPWCCAYTPDNKLKWAHVLCPFPFFFSEWLQFSSTLNNKLIVISSQIWFFSIKVPTITKSPIKNSKQGENHPIVYCSY
jgi:hypothetical protein